MESSKSEKRVWIELFVLSMLALFFELLVLRWLSGNYRAFTVFKTFPLAACFVGLGLGYAFPEKNWYRYTPLALVVFIAIIQITQVSGFWHWVFPSFGIYVSQREQMPADWGYIATFILFLISLLAGPFMALACLGSRLALLFNQLKPLEAYCVNIGGSIAGSLLFAVLSFAGCPPWFLLCLFLAILWFYAIDRTKMTVIIPLLLVGFFSWFDFGGSSEVQTYWSPYQRIDVYPFTLGTEEDAKNAGSAGVTIAANGHFYQYALDLRPSALEGHSAKMSERLASHARNYNLPHKLKKAESMLILGAGSGNDVAAALRASDKISVEAVDIDPMILDLGRRLHPEKPYDSTRVNATCDDARHYLSNCKKKFDLIVFAGLDSLTVTGKGASVRVDNYIYTKESLSSALSLLNPDGLLVLSFCNSKPWLTQRIFSTLKSAAGYDPRILVDAANPELPWEIYLSGPAVRDGMKLPDITPFAIRDTPAEAGRVLSDDWPYMYVTPVAFDAPYLLVVAILLSLTVLTTRRILLAPYEGINWQMFFLGSAFMLLELQSIARLSLLFGSTWWTSAIVINGILVMILGANVLVLKIPALAKSQTGVYLALFVSVLLSYFLPVNLLRSNLPDPLVAPVITIATVLPVFLAGIIFASAFKQVSNAGRALTFNLLGAVLGAMLEYLSNYIGISGLVLCSGALYLFSFIAYKTIKISEPTQIAEAS